MQRRLALGVPGVAVVTGAGLWLQVHKVASADLPRFDDHDPSGVYGNPSAQTVRIDALGDSSITGPGLDRPSDSWIAQIVDQLPYRVELRCRARGGSRVADVLREQAPETAADPPDLVVVSVGSNDVLHATPRLAFRRDLTELLTVLGGVAPVVSLGIGDLSVIPRLTPMLRLIVARRCVTLDSVQRSVAETVGVVRVPVPDLSDPHFAEGGAELFTADLFHPGRRGHALWADLFGPYVEDGIARSWRREGAQAPGVVP